MFLFWSYLISQGKNWGNWIKLFLLYWRYVLNLHGITSLAPFWSRIKVEDTVSWTSIMCWKLGLTLTVGVWCLPPQRPNFSSVWLEKNSSHALWMESISTPWMEHEIQIFNQSEYHISLSTEIGSGWSCGLSQANQKELGDFLWISGTIGSMLSIGFREGGLRWWLLCWHF